MDSKQPTVSQIPVHQIPISLQRSDEIDLRELFKVLWNGRVTIAVTLVFAICAVDLCTNCPRMVVI